ncbi:MAG: hypothetical protein A2010_14280 [Nitrospirae bacterium GWD2_57_9]|nr:MAG: hypothetical protein A2010_14280 [Nitrospirae bacterium GWD2_57_9]OGW46040.1 MAG: hypothetical protein A2078_11785 [Nitrospirae bacterium GWC2_57_9]
MNTRACVDFCYNERRQIDRSVKAIVSSGYVDAPILKESRRHGFADSIAKPYDLAALLNVFAESWEKS